MRYGSTFIKVIKVFFLSIHLLNQNMIAHDSALSVSFTFPRKQKKKNENWTISRNYFEECNTILFLNTLLF